MHILGEIDPIAEEQLELLLQLNFVDETAPALELHEQVDVALRMSCISGDRAVDTDVRCGVTGREPQDLLSLRAKERQVRWRRARRDRPAHRHGSRGTSTGATVRALAPTGTRGPATSIQRFVCCPLTATSEEIFRRAPDQIASCPGLRSGGPPTPGLLRPTGLPQDAARRTGRQVLAWLAATATRPVTGR